jgi:hypothetical protein
MKTIRAKHIMLHSIGSKSYARGCHEKVYFMIVTSCFNIYA